MEETTALDSVNDRTVINLLPVIRQIRKDYRRTINRQQASVFGLIRLEEGRSGAESFDFFKRAGDNGFFFLLGYVFIIGMY